VKSVKELVEMDNLQDWEKEKLFRAAFLLKEPEDIYWVLDNLSSVLENAGLTSLLK
jgi:hypothetical protein